MVNTQPQCNHLLIVCFLFCYRAFSNEYLQIASPLALASVKILRETQKRYEINHANIQFNLHDLWRLIKGVTFSTPDTAPDIATMIRLWVHEVS